MVLKGKNKFRVIHPQSLNTDQQKALAELYLPLMGQQAYALYHLLNAEGYFTDEERKRMVEALRCVDLVIPEENWEQKINDVQEFKIDTFVMGDDWKGKFDFLKDYCEVVYLPRTPEISTTQIKKDLNNK